MTGRVLHSLADLNGDGIADLGILSLEGGSLWKMHSNYEVHFGMLEAGSLRAKVAVHRWLSGNSSVG